MPNARYEYGDGFFNYNDLADESAEYVIKVLLDKLSLQSVLDIGCARGIWLKKWENSGVNSIHGVDGEYLDRNKIVIDDEQFTCRDIAQPFDLGKKFDLVQCLEVAEHIDEKNADDLVENLVRHGDMILFSAATPGQGGEHHVNEQWYEYWYKRFQKHSFTAYDWIRPRIANAKQVSCWYRYNIFLFVGRRKEGQLPKDILKTKCEDLALQDIAPIQYILRRYVVRCIPRWISNRIARMGYR